jgi:hypothetical protein
MFFGRKKEVKETVDISELHERAHEQRIVEGYKQKQREERKAKFQGALKTIQGIQRNIESNTQSRTKKEKRRKEKKIPYRNAVSANKLNKPIGIAGEFKW